MTPNTTNETQALEITGEGWDALIAALNRSEAARLELKAAQEAATEAAHAFLAKGGTLKQVASASADIMNARTAAEIQAEIDAAPWPVVRLYRELDEACTLDEAGNVRPTTEEEQRAFHEEGTCAPEVCRHCSEEAAR